MDSETRTLPQRRTPGDPAGDPAGDATGTTAPTPPAAPPPPPGDVPPPPTPAAGAQQRPRGLPLRSYVAVAAVAALSAAAVVVPTTLAEDATTTAAPIVATQGDAEAQVQARPLVEDGQLVAAVADRLSPSVVRIDVSGAAGAGSGSGVVLDAEGRILTNAHVVDGASQVGVTTPDGQRLEAEVVGADPNSDIAVLQVDAQLPVPTFAAGEAGVGESAIAIGSPFGLDGSVTSGVVSALNRTISGQGAPLVDMLQTDAAINPGNSGGALANAAGEVIGINTAILSRTGANNGIGFAVPIATALDVAQQLVSNGEVRTGWLGIEGQTVDPDVAELYGLGTTSGAIVAAVVPDSPADEAGLVEGDVVVAVDGEEVGTMADLAGRVRRVAPGETTALTVLRAGEEQTLEVTLGERPEQVG